MNLINAYWQHLITREKVLWKSATMYYAALMAALPDLLSYTQANWPAVTPFVPHVLQEKGLQWVALGVAVCRLRSMVKLPGKKQ